jgi:hypothetical protein
MNSQPVRDLTIGQLLVAIAHSSYSEPVFVVEGIGPASFRAHYLTLGNGIILDLFTAEIFVASLPEITMPGETEGMPVDQIVGRRIVEVVQDDEASSLIILEGGIFLKDDNDGFYGNPLRAGLIGAHYSVTELAKFVDYWDETPAQCSKIRKHSSDA